MNQTTNTENKTTPKYKLTTESIHVNDRTLFRIEALRNFGKIKTGEKGGFIEEETNLSHLNNAWVYGDAWVHGNARVLGNARVYGDAQVSGNARVYGDARVFGNAWVFGDAWVHGNVWVYGDAWVHGDARVSGDARVLGNAQVSGDTWVHGNAQVFGDARVYGDAQVSGDARVFGNANLSSVEHHCTISPIGSEGGVLTAFLQKDGTIAITRGCYFGTIDQFEDRVKEIHGDNQYAKAYLAAIPFIKQQLSRP